MMIAPMIKLEEQQLSRVAGTWDALERWEFGEIIDRDGTLEFTIADEFSQKCETYTVDCFGYRKFGEHDILLYLPDIRYGVYLARNSEFFQWAVAANPIEDHLSQCSHFLVVSVDGVLEYIGSDPPQHLSSSSAMQAGVSRH